MKKILILTAGALMLLPSCIQEFAPQQGTVTEDQAANAPGSYENFVSALTSSVAGQFTFPGSGYQKPNDFGYPSLILMREMTGNDMVAVGGGYNWFSTWYQSSVTLAPIYLNCQYPWTYYFGQIKNSNTVLNLAGENPSDLHKAGAGMAYAWRAFYYLDLAQMYSQVSYGQDKTTPTVPIVTEKLDLEAAANNPRATYEEMLTFILSDLDKAETYLTGYTRTSKEQPDLSVVNGLRARVYLLMEDWANAEKYAKLAQQGYTVMTGEQYNNKVNGFNDANYNNAWMLCCSFKKDDACMVYQDGNHSWGSWMINELPNNGEDGYGYYSKYGAGNYIDYHLYQTIPATDARKKCYVDFKADEAKTANELLSILSEYSDVPVYVFNSGNAVASNTSGANAWGGMPLKFRAKGGNHESNLDAYCVDVPLMRVEEMVLIEAEAAGRQDENRGKVLLETFAKTRDASYVYGKHNDAYNNTSTSQFVNEIWWQRRVEFWGEGLAMYDVKRLNKGIIRSYPNTNHVKGYRWNTITPPQWMTFCIVQTETNSNPACTNNPTPIAPTADSPEQAW